MKVLFDHQVFEMQRFGGISRYFFELINDFSKDDDVNWELPVLYSENEYLKNMVFFRDRLLSPPSMPDPFAAFMFGRQFRGKGLLYRAKNKFFPSAPMPLPDDNKSKVIKKLIEGDFDIFHPTYYDDYFIDYIGDKPFVLTVYDLIHQVFPEFLLYEKPDKSKRLLDKAAKILAISESTKKDLVNIFNIDEQKIVVTLLSNSLDLHTSVVSEEFKNKFPSQFLLFVGNRTGYKNFLFFMQIFAAIGETEKQLSVVCTGPAFNEKELFFFHQAGIKNRVFHTYVSDAELVFLYKNAVALVFPSMYEGFGLPILEAFGCGCPVLASNTSSMSEIGGDAVIYFEPKSAASMKGALKTVLFNDELKMEKVNKGYLQLQKFSWHKTAAETKEVYKEIISVRATENQKRMIRN